MSNRFIAKMWHPYHVILLNSKKEQTIDTHNLDGSQGHHVEWQKPISKGHILYLCNIIEHDKITEMEISGHQELETVSRG